MYYAKLVRLRGEWGFNMIRVTRSRSGSEGRFHVEQFCVPHGEQDTPASDVRYDRGILTFVANGKIETVELHEIDSSLGDKLLEERNWANLTAGLANKSEKTVEWLQKKGLSVP